MLTKEQLDGGFRLGEWEIQPRRGALTQGDEEVRPEPLVWRVLLVLAARDGELVTKDELIEDAWGGRIVGDDAIARAITQLRRALGDDSRAPRFVETLQRRGYRLMQPVELLVPSESEEESADVPEQGPSIRAWRAVAGVLAVGFVGIIVWMLLKSAPVGSIAIMPFENQTGNDADDFRVAGFQIDLVQALHPIQDLTVIRIREGTDPEPDAAESVLAGFVRRNGEQLIVNYEISRDGKVVYIGEVTDHVDNYYDLQEQLAGRVQEHLGGVVSQTLLKSRPADSEAYDSYIRGIVALDRRGEPLQLEESIRLFQESIELDDTYGPAYLGLATAYALMVDYRKMPLDEYNGMAVATIEDGIAADPAITDQAGAVFGYIYHREKRWSEAEVAYERAVNAPIVDSNAFNWYSRMLASVGRLDDALELAKRAVEIDPSSAVINSRVAIAYTWTEDSANAHRYFERSNTLGASGATHLLGYAFLLAREGKLEQARNLTAAGMRMAGASDAWIPPVFAALADPQQVPQALAAINDASAARQLAPQIELTVRALLGDVDGAMNVAKLLELPGEIFEMDLLFVPELAALRLHPEFLPLMERLNHVDYWRERDCTFENGLVSCPQPGD